MAPSPRSSPWRRIHLSDGVRGLWPGVYSGVPGAGVRWLCPLSVKHSRGRAHCDGVQGATTLRRRRRAVSGAQDRALGCVPTPARPVTSPPPPISSSRGRRGEASGRRRLVPTASAGWSPSPLALGAAKSAVRGPSAEAKKSARRRRRAPAEDSSRRPRRALPRAGDGCRRCGFSHRGSRERQRQWHTRDGTRTAARLRRGLLARSASLAALHARPRALH